MTAYSIKRANNRESAEAMRQREERERIHAEYYIWACAGCGPCETSRGSWCDKGCGSDYPGMIDMPRHLLKRIQDEASRPAVEQLEHELAVARSACNELWLTRQAIGREAAILREEVNATRYLADGANFPDPHDADQYRCAKARLMKAKRATDAIGEVTP